MTWSTYNITSTSSTTSSTNYFTRRPTNQPLWSTSTGSNVYDCSGMTSWLAQAQEQQRKKERERKRKEDELMSAFDEVFNG